MLDLDGSWPQDRCGRDNPFGYLGIDFYERDIARQYHDGDPALSDGNTNGALENLWKLPGIGDQLDVVATNLEEAFRMRGLEIVNADFAAWDMGSDRQNGHSVALAIE